MIVLHIGMNKTGSTSIQSWLKENRFQIPFSQLETFGVGNAWKIGAACGGESSTHYWVEVRKRLTAEEITALRSRFWNDTALEVERENIKTAIASSEYLFSQIGDDPAKLVCFEKKLKEVFGEVKVIVYLRDQVTWLKSVYAERVKGPRRETRSFDAFLMTEKKVRLRANYRDRLKLWIDVFGKDAIIPVVFDKRNFPNGNLVEDFCLRAGLHDNPTFSLYAARSQNVSPRSSKLEALRILNKLGLRNLKGQRFLAAAVGTVWPRKKDSSGEILSRIIDEVSDGNRWLNEEFFEDFVIKLPVKN